MNEDHGEKIITTEERNKNNKKYFYNSRLKLYNSLTS